MSKSRKIKHLKPVANQTVRSSRPKPVLVHVQEAFSTKWKLLIAAALAVLAVAVYSPSRNYDFVYDDDAVVKDNRYVKEGIGGLGKIWTTSYFSGYDENIVARAYRPVPLTTLALEVEMFGLNPSAHHTSNLLLYGATAFFLFLFLSKLLRRHHPFLPVAISLLFVLHPIHLEVVANIKSRDTMLGFLGFLLAGWFLLKHLDNRRWLPLALSLLFYFAGLFSKEEVITTVAVIPLMLWFFRNYPLRRVAFASLPFLGAAVVFLAVRSYILGGLNEGVTLTPLDNSLLGAKDFAERSASTVFVLGHYLLKTVFPHPLISDYSHSTLPLTNWGDWRVWLSLLANLGLLAAGIRGLLKREWYGFGALCYFCTVSIFTSIVTPNVSAYNDRFLYSPVLGILFLLGWLLMKMVKPADEPTPVEPRVFFKNNFLPVAAVALLSAAGVYKITTHLPVWKDRFALFAHDAKLTPNNARTRKNHGGSLARLAVQNQQDNPELAKQQAVQAIAELQAALSIYHNIPTGHIHLGNMHLIRGEYPEAEKSLRTALELEPTSYFARNSLANVLYRTGRLQESADLMESIDPKLRSKNDWKMMSQTYARLGNDQKASEYLQRSQ